MVTTEVAPLVCSVLAAPSVAEEIPIDQVWSISRIPGTRDIFQLEKGLSNEKIARLAGRWHRHGGRGTLTHDLYKVLETKRNRASKTGDRSPAKPGFAVSGHGHEALKAAHAVLVNGKEPQTKFAKGEPIAIVFFTHWSRKLHFEKLEQSDHGFTIKYQFTTRPDRYVDDNGANIALIPTIVQKAGPFRVDIERVPTPVEYQEQRIKSTDSQQFGSVEMAIMKPFQIEIE